MSARKLIATLLGAVIAVAQPITVRAAPPDPAPEPGIDGESTAFGLSDSDAGSNKLVAGAGHTSTSATTGGGTPSAATQGAPRCVWTPSTLGHDSALTNPVYRDATTKRITDQPGPNTEQLYWVSCGDGPGQYRWHTAAEYIDPQIVINQAIDTATARVPLPDLDIWPAPEYGVPVNYGIWFALHDPGTIAATAQTGPVWATATAVHHSLSVDLDNGTTITCNGLGTPHPQDPAINREPNPYREGPCGYTYQYVSELGHRHVTITSHWATHLITSTGINQSLDPIHRPVSFDYEVYEIVTVLVPEPPD